jgi:hypothetical protein
MLYSVSAADSNRVNSTEVLPPWKGVEKRVGQFPVTQLTTVLRGE